MAMSLAYFLLLAVGTRFFSSPHLTTSTTPSLGKRKSLSVENPDDVLVSPKGVFSAGFFPVGHNAYCFGIWFTKPSYDGNSTVVWMANRDQPVNGKKSKLSLLKTGDLILTDAGQFITWRTNTLSKSSSVQLLLLDTGNLVLTQTTEDLVLWQSFDSPTDTLLAQQPLTRYTKLISSRSRWNFSSGYYKLSFDDSNVLRLVFDGPETSSIYWPNPRLLDDEAGRSRYNDTRIAVFGTSGRFTSSDRVNVLAADFGSGVARRLTLDYDGNLRMYSLLEDRRTWIVSWQAVSVPCRIHGICGVNGICTYDSVLGHSCSCLPGFKMKNLEDWSQGCDPEFKMSCNKNDGIAFVPFHHVEFFGYNIDILRNYSLKKCKNQCLELCCVGFQYRFIKNEGAYTCYLKRLLRNGHRSLNFIGTLYLKVPKSFASFYEIPVPEGVFKLNCLEKREIEQLSRSYREEKASVALKILVWSACALGFVELVFVFVVVFFLHRTHKNPDAAAGGYDLMGHGIRRFSYDELKKATRGFGEVIGRGGGGVVYKGEFPDQRVAAIKRLNEANQGEEEFLAEVNTIGRLNHMNLIDMWGYCAEGKHRLLVYEFMENGSMGDRLYTSSLDWEKRFKIALGTARGLAYLHEECLEWVLHCDVKPQNILLDADYNPKVADFGLSKMVDRRGADNSNFSRIRGTRGYMAPEWVFKQPITSKVDVYSYGVVVLEMMTGRSPSVSINSEEDVGHRSLVAWVRQRRIGATGMPSYWVQGVADPSMGGNYDADKLETCVDVALQCVMEDKDARPTMSRVVEMLT